MKYLGFFLVIFLVSCGDPKEKEIQMLSDEAIAVHDEVMPMMDKLYVMRTGIQKRVQEDSTLLTDELAATLVELKEAEDAMWNWMRNFNLQYEGENQDSTIAYFTRKKSSAEIMADQMKKAMIMGEETMKTFE